MHLTNLMQALAKLQSDAYAAQRATSIRQLDARLTDLVSETARMADAANAIGDNVREVLWRDASDSLKHTDSRDMIACLREKVGIARKLSWYATGGIYCQVTGKLEVPDVD